MKNIENSELATTLESHLETGITPEARTILQDAIYRILNIGKYISTLFKRGTTLTIEPTEELVINEKNIRKSLAKVIQREKDRGNEIEVYIDNDIWNWDALKNVTMPKIIKSFTSVIHHFLQTLSHKQIRNEADKLAVQKDWNIAQAWNIIIAGILAGEVDTKGTGIFAYFTLNVDGKDILFRFNACRDGDGELGVDVFTTPLDIEWDAGNGTCLSN